MSYRYAWQSPYACFNNNPIYCSDPLGLEGTDPVKKGDSFTGTDGKTYHASMNEATISAKRSFWDKVSGVRNSIVDKMKQTDVLLNKFKGNTYAQWEHAVQDFVNIWLGWDSDMNDRNKKLEKVDERGDATGSDPLISDKARGANGDSQTPRGGLYFNIIKPQPPIVNDPLTEQSKTNPNLYMKRTDKESSDYYIYDKNGNLLDSTAGFIPDKPMWTWDNDGNNDSSYIQVDPFNRIK